jgi:hypothetical protein
MEHAPAFTLKLTNRQRRIIRVQLEAVLFFEGSTGYDLPELGLDRLAILATKLDMRRDSFDAAELFWLHSLATGLTSRKEHSRHDVEALADMLHDIERLTT